MIHIFTSKGFQHIDGHKELSKDEPIVKVTPEKVYVPAVDNKGIPLVGLVQSGTTVSKGTLLGVRKDFEIPVYSPVAGTVTGLVSKLSMTIGRAVNFLEITLDKDQNESVKLNPLKTMDKESVVAKLKEGGIVGLGGAGFPSYIKYNTNDPIDTILVNAIECEPYLTTDYVMGIKASEDVFLALPALMKASGATKVVFGVKKDKVHLIEAIQKAIDSNDAGSYASIVLVKDAYPMGWEKTLIKHALKRSYEGLPSKCGVIVNNLQTLMAIGRLFSKGEIITDKVYTVSGSVSKPGNYAAPVGITVDELVKAAGGYPSENVLIAYGGPMTSKAVTNGEAPMLLPASGLTVFTKKEVTSYPEPCLRCGACTDHCPCNLQPVEIKDTASKMDVEGAIALKADQCVECGLCSYVCPSHIDVTGQVAKMKRLVKLKTAPKPAVAPKAPAKGGN